HREQKDIEQQEQDGDASHYRIAGTLDVPDHRRHIGEYFESAFDRTVLIAPDRNPGRQHIDVARLAEGAGLSTQGQFTARLSGEDAGEGGAVRAYFSDLRRIGGKDGASIDVVDLDLQYAQPPHAIGDRAVHGLELWGCRQGLAGHDPGL